MEAARRELEEETTIVAPKLIYLFEFGGLTKRHHVFFTDLREETEAAPCNEILRCRWFHPHQVSTLMTSVPTREIVQMTFGHKIVTIPLRADSGELTLPDAAIEIRHTLS